MTEASKIKCPGCGVEISVNDVLHTQLDTQIRKEYEEKQRKERDALAVKEAELSKKAIELEDAKRNEASRIANAVKDQLIQKEIDIRKLAKQEAEKDQKAMLDLLQSQVIDKDKKLQEARTAQAELMKEKAKLQDDKAAFEIEKLKQLETARSQIAEQEAKKASEASENRIAQMQKKLDDALKVNDELNRKLQQGSQQAQGEVEELRLEESLRTMFPQDRITEVVKGQAGADIIQVACNNAGQSCGKILWEVKHTKNWIEGWVQKFKDDLIQENSDLGVIVTAALPDGVTGFSPYNGVWVCDMAFALPLARALHVQLESLTREKNLAIGQDDKQKILYEYITGNQFRQRVGAIVDVFKGLEEDLAMEKRWFKKKWAKTEKHIERVINNMAGMQGDLEGMVSLPTIPALALEFDDGEIELEKE